ncbi:branched-chain amino acid aminotransferase [Paraglaciecola sp. L3A3]|uniref:branched-chain amino acid aminotransferase n=1 Tax=Paraglaciecola sp. L3A3 TaxID=2686358 RepID=UPI00131AE970|nr:branched-chain amino acid aminotransferase [Paraglaciecola sp. L3A3]
MSAFGTVFMPKMALTTFENGQWSEAKTVSSDSIQLHPGAHVLHYSSTCFEGLKAFKHQDGSVHVFRMDQNINRFDQSSNLLHLPQVNQQQVSDMILDIVAQYKDEIPEPPGSMYIRPTHIGTEAAVGKAAAPSATSILYVLISPVGDYFAGGSRPLRILLDETGMRCAPHMGMIKSGGNYASALGPILQAKEQVQADQILFCPNGDVQETGAANFILIDGNEVITKALSSEFLHGVTRDSVLKIAADLGMTVSERDLTVTELLERAAKPNVEAALSGTAAVLTSVGTLIHNGQEYKVGTGENGPTTQKLRQALNEIQWGQAEDNHNWLTEVK